MDNIKPFRPGSETVSSFHLSHVRSLIRSHGAGGDAIDPGSNEAGGDDRVAGQVTVRLPGGRVSRALAYEAPACEDLPSRRLAHGVLNGTTYWFRCADAPGVREDFPCFRAYFGHEGAWFFFSTQGAVLPFGAEVNFSGMRSSAQTAPMRLAANN